MINEMWATIAIVGVVGIAVIAAYFLESRRLPAKRARIQDREPMSMVQIFDQHYRSDGLVEARFVELWTAAAQLSKMDPTRLRPTDRFDVELAPLKNHLVEDELVDLQEFYERECRRLGLKSLPRLQTLDDFIRTLGAHVVP